MHQLLSYIKLLPFILITLLALLVLSPSFNLALTGDDYLSLWRYRYYLEGHTPSGNWNNFNFLFTDYGPQDSLFTLIHHFFGFNPLAFYTINFLLRMIAAFSVYKVTKQLTQKTAPALVASLFFAITSTGLETTNWSFNMPSYIAVCCLNLFIYYRLKIIEHFSWLGLVITYVLFTFSILSQPIRMTYLPVSAIVLEFLLCFLNKSRYRQLSIIIGYPIIFIFIIIFGYIGNSVGAGESFQTRIIEQGWTKLLGNNFGHILNLLAEQKYQILLYPIAQIGNIIWPNHLFPFSVNPVASQGAKLSIGLLTAVVTLISTTGFWWKKTNPITTFIFSLITLAWTLLIWFSLIWSAQYPITTGELVSFLIGGNAIILITFLLFLNWQNRRIIVIGCIGTSLLVLGFLTPWLRNPTFLFETTGRYLIIPAVGLSLLVGLLTTLTYQAKKPQLLMISIITLLIIHASASYHYLAQLSKYRPIKQTEQLRRSIPFSYGFLKPDEPMIYYFEPHNSQEIYHSFLFGFPLIMGFQYNFFSIWHIAYTDQWSEVTSAYLDGQILQRFSIPVKPVKLSNIYSYRYKNGQMIDTTIQTHAKLLLIKSKP